MNGAHVCMTGSLECSGIDPCEGCASVIVTAVLVPAMKAAEIHHRDDPRVMAFLQTYTMARKSLTMRLLDQAAQGPGPLPGSEAAQASFAGMGAGAAAPKPQPLTEAELEAMSRPVGVVGAQDITGTGPSVVGEEGLVAGMPEAFSAAAAATAAVFPIPVGELSPLPVEPLTPPGMLTDAELRARFPNSIVPGIVMGMPDEAPLPLPATEAAAPVTGEGKVLDESDDDEVLVGAATATSPASNFPPKTLSRGSFREPRRRKPAAEATTDTMAVTTEGATTAPAKTEATSNG